MVGLAFVAAFVLCATILLGRAVAKRRRRTRWHQAPGRSPERAIVIKRFDEIDDTIAATRCYCGGRLSLVSEGSRGSGDLLARVVRCECASCEASLDLFFEQSVVLH